MTPLEPQRAVKMSALRAMRACLLAKHIPYPTSRNSVKKKPCISLISGTGRTGSVMSRRWFLPTTLGQMRPP